MLRRFGVPPERGRSYIVRRGVYALLPGGDAVLLTRQIAPHEELQLPGGGVEPGESPLRALHREVLEETGWRIATPRRVGAYRRFAWMAGQACWADKVCVVYRAHPVRRLAAPCDPDHAALWLGRAAAARRLADPGARHVVAFGGVPGRAACGRGLR